MKTALITTTINVPHVLRLYRALDPDVRFFVALDKKSQFTELARWGNDSSYSWLTPQFQEQYKCSEPIGWNCIQRRNIALLEALKWGAEIIVTIDDDNIPIGRDYFRSALAPFVNMDPMRLYDGLLVPYRAPVTFDGIEARSGLGWFDVGRLLDPVAPHRGFPHIYRYAEPSFHPITQAKVGVAAGICMGDPDIDATTRMAVAPTVHRVSELLRAGTVTDPNRTWTVFNSQNTAFIRELAPAMFMLPGCGRYDDIFASLITQRVMRDRGYHVHFGQPFVWQTRNQHNLVNDLKAELLGMEHTVEFTDWLASLQLSGPTVADDVRGIFTLMNALPWMPAQAREAGLAWCDDIAAVMG